MEIRLANTSDIPGSIALLRQVGQVHHDIRPDLFRDGAQKYSPSDLEDLMKDILEVLRDILKTMKANKGGNAK